jgi:hypothetical protein
MESGPLSNPARARLSWRWLAIALLLLFSAIAMAHAQIPGHSHPQKDQPQTPQQSRTPPEMPAVPEIWPRAENDALMCKSRDDLVRYQTQIVNGANDPTAGQAPDCHTIRKQTGIQILARDGPSHTQIVTTDESKETGWTNSYLPSTPPASVAKGPGAGKCCDGFCREAPASNPAAGARLAPLQAFGSESGGGAASWSAKAAQDRPGSMLPPIHSLQAVAMTYPGVLAQCG